MKHLLYRHPEDALDAGTAVIIAKSIRSEPARWTLEGDKLVRDDEILVYLPEREGSRFAAPAFRLFDIHGESYDVDPPKLAGLVLRRAVETWMRQNGVANDTVKMTIAA